MNDSYDPSVEDWEIRECKDYPSRAYYYNKCSGASRWFLPPESKSESERRPVYLCQIVMKGDDEKTELQCRKIRQELERDISKFEELANNYSAYSAGGTGGVLGWVRKEQLPPELADAAWRLEPGELSEVLKSPLGFHIVLRKA